MTLSLRLKLIVQETIQDKTVGTKLLLCFILSLLVHLLAAFTSEGFMHHDEHYQIMEFANYKLGHVTGAELPMEFQEQMRSWFLPALVYSFFQFLPLLGVENPFDQVIALKVVMGFFACLVFWVGAIAVLRLVKFSQIKILIPVLFLATWFVPYLQVRTSSDNLSAQFFLLALFIQMLFYPQLFCSKQNHARVASLALPDFLTGVLLGLAFVLRFHIVFLIATFALWLILTKKFSFKKFSLIGFGILAAGIIGWQVDSWGYGESVVSWVNYIQFSFSSHIQSTILPSPWYQYFKYMLVRGVPPFGLIYFIAFLFLGFKHRTHWLFWFFIVYVGIHSLIGHKEVRYLYPLYLLAPIALSLWLDDRMERGKSFKQFTLSFFIFLSLAVQLVSVLKPANNAVPFYRKMQTSLPPNITIEYSGEHPYVMVGYTAKFYMWRKDIAYIEQDKEALADPVGERYFFSRTGEEFFQYQARPSCELSVAGIDPQFLKYNYFNWVKRSRVWAIWRCS